MKLGMIAFLLFLISIGGASAKWDYSEAKETRLLKNGSMQKGVDM